MVGTHGWAVTGVFGDPAGEWAYSIGLWHTFGSPELCLVGVPHQYATRYVNTVAGQIRDGDPLEPGRVRTGVMGGHHDTLGIAPVHDSWYPRLFGAAIDYYQRPPFPMVQLVWPDGSGRFLWDPEVHDGNRDRQPSLFLPLDQAAAPWQDR